MPDTPGSDASQGAWRAGLLYSLLAHVMWGSFPIYYDLLSGYPADIIVPHRIIWSLVFVALYLALVSRLREVREILATPRHAPRLVLSGTIILVNWSLFVWAVGEDRFLEVSFGYFCTPLASVFIGLVVLRERLSRPQAISVGLAAVAVVFQGIMLGGLPWLALALSLSFATYGYIRKTVPVGAIPGLMVETLATTPLALGFLAWLFLQGRDILPPMDVHLDLALFVGTGIFTALPLAFFAMGARRLPLTTFGILQYLTPSLQFLVALWVFSEPLSLSGLFAFSLIWVSLAIYSVDMALTARQSRRAHRREPLGRRSEPVR